MYVKFFHCFKLLKSYIKISCWKGEFLFFYSYSFDRIPFLIKNNYTNKEVFVLNFCFQVIYKIRMKYKRVDVYIT